MIKAHLDYRGILPETEYLQRIQFPWSSAVLQFYSDIEGIRHALVTDCLPEVYRRIV